MGFACIIDALSRYAFTMCLADKSAAGIAAFLEETMFAYGAQKMLQADSAAENKSASVRLVAERFGVQTLRFTKPHASQENGMVERSFRTLKDGLRRAVLETQSTKQPVGIVDLLRNVTKSYNITPHASLGNLSPWDVFFGRKPPRITGAVLLASAEDSSPGNQQGGGTGAGGAKAQQDGTSVSRSSMGRRTAAEIRDLASQAGSAGGARQWRASALLSEEDFALPSQSKGKSRLPLTATMSALAAARVRLGVPPAASSAAGSRGLLGAVVGRAKSASRGGASSSDASGSAGGLQAERALAIAFDQTAGKLLYLMQWAPPFQHQPSWVYASTMGDSDAALQAWIKKDTGHKPVVFENPFLGIDSSLDRGRPISMQVVLQGVEDAADHQSEARGLQDEREEEEDGVMVSSAGGSGRNAVAAASPLRVDDSGPMDALRKAQQAAEAAAAAAQAVVTAARQERVASAMRGLRQELESNDEGESSSSKRGTGRASSNTHSIKPGRGRR